MRSPAYGIWSKQSNRYIKTFSTLSGVRKAFFLLQLVFAQVQWKDTVIKTTIHVPPVFCALQFMEARKTCYRVLRTSIWSILYYEELCNKNCTVKTSRRWSSEARSVALRGPINQMQLRVPDQLLKRVVIVFRIHNGHVELLSTYWY